MIYSFGKLTKAETEVVDRPAKGLTRINHRGFLTLSKSKITREMIILTVIIREMGVLSETIREMGTYREGVILVEEAEGAGASEDGHNREGYSMFLWRR